MNRWSQKEIEILKEYYPLEGTKGVQKRISKSRGSIIVKAYRLQIQGFQTLNNISRNQKDLSYITEISNPFAAYFLGFLWADGHIDKQFNCIRFKIISPDFEEIKHMFFPLFKDWDLKERWDGIATHTQTTTLSISHATLHDFLVQNNYHIKSGTSADKILSIIPEYLRHYWWRGYFDGDGNFYFHRGASRIVIAACFKQDWNFAKILEDQFNICYVVHKGKKEKYSYSNLNITGEFFTKRFMSYILQGEQFGLQRKYNKYYQYLIYRENKKRNRTSKFRGVSKEFNKWTCSISCNKKYYQYSCNTELEAALLYDQMAKKFFGKKAHLNFPIPIDTISEINLDLDQK
jgi:hypothetical protein